MPDRALISRFSRGTVSRRTLFAGLALLSLAEGVSLAGDSMRGKITAVLGPDLVRFDYGAGQYTLRIAGLDVPKQAAGRAQSFVGGLVLNKEVRLRLVENEEGTGEMLVRLQTADPASGFKDVSIEVIAAGLARKHAGFDFKYGELATAETQARLARRGLWSAQ